MQGEVFKAFRVLDVPEDKAMRAAVALGRREDEVTSLKGELLVIKWVMGLVLAFQLAIFAKLFIG